MSICVHGSERQRQDAPRFIRNEIGGSDEFSNLRQREPAVVVRQLRVHGILQPKHIKLTYALVESPTFIGRFKTKPIDVILVIQ